MKYGQQVYDYEKKQGTGLSPIGDTRRTVEQPGYLRQPDYQLMGEGQQVQQVDAPEVQQPQQNAPSIDYNQKLNDLYAQIMNRPAFSFDLNKDALYQQLKDSYVENGRLAMMDTMGQAATLTGGYGNSYAQGVGQQAYQQYLQGLTDEIPDLYQMALNNYMMEGDAMYDQLAALQWKAEFDEDQRRYDQAWEQEYGTGTGGNTGGNSTGNHTGNPTGNPTGNHTGNDTGDDFTQAELSAAGQNFLKNLPYLHAGGDVEGWKRTVAGRMYRYYEQGALSDTDVDIIMLRLGLEDAEPDTYTQPKEEEKKEDKNKGSSGGGSGTGSIEDIYAWW